MDAAGHDGDPVPMQQDAEDSMVRGQFIEDADYVKIISSLNEKQMELFHQVTFQYILVTSINHLTNLKKLT